MRPSLEGGLTAFGQWTVSVFVYLAGKDLSESDWIPHTRDVPVAVNGGIFAWRDGRENPDTFQALLTYPKGFLVSYSTSFGNDATGYTRIMGKKATLYNTGGEGSPRWKIVEEVGNHEDDRNVEEKRKSRDILLPGDTTLPPTEIPDEDLSHITNWFDCLRSRKQPNATVHHGFSHSVACIMAAESYWSGQKMYFDPKSEVISDRRLKTEVRTGELLAIGKSA